MSGGVGDRDCPTGKAGLGLIPWHPIWSPGAEPGVSLQQHRAEWESQLSREVASLVLPVAYGPQEPQLCRHFGAPALHRSVPESRCRDVGLWKGPSSHWQHSTALSTCLPALDWRLLKPDENPVRWSPLREGTQAVKTLLSD